MGTRMHNGDFSGITPQQEGYTEKIANLTLHRATEEQIADGVVNLSEEKREELKRLLTYSEPPSQGLLEWDAYEIAELILGRYNKAMIGGAPYLMRPLEEELERMGIEVFYSFSKRETEEIPQEDGTVKKVSVFRHTGFVKGKGSKK